MNESGEVAYIEIENLRESRIQLRPVDKRTVEYRELKDSIKANGLWQPVLVRPMADDLFEIIDGFYRYSCCKELRIKTIPCLIRELTDREVLIVQIQANAVRLETNPIDYARQMWRIIKEEKELTVAEMSQLINKSPIWVNRMLQISRLCLEVSNAVQRGQLSITIAHELAKVPAPIQKDLLTQAMITPVGDFLPIVAERIRQFKQAIKTGRMQAYYASLIKPVPHLRKMKELRAELKKPTEGAHFLVQVNAKTPLAGWRACLNWVLHLDPVSVKEQKQRLAKRQIYENEQAELRKQDRKNRRGRTNE